MKDEFTAYLLEILVNAARIDGSANDAEREAIVAAMSAATEAPFARADVDAALEKAALSKHELESYLGKHGGRFSSEQRMTILRGLLAVIAADKTFDDREQALLLGYIEAVGFKGGRAPGILDALIQPFRNAV